MKCGAGIFLYCSRFRLPPPVCFIVSSTWLALYTKYHFLLFLFFCPYVLLPPLVLPSSSLHTLLPSHLPISLSRRGEHTHEEASKYVVKKLKKKKNRFFMVGLFCFHLSSTRKRKKLFFFYPTPTIDLGDCSGFCSEFRG